ncbi:DUF924 family protein [Bdellovibrio sp. HCB337]|uniref:DUF924 family protein n=1 Tax=Bdellovibrio sp. HCB337 TaxID=3394358 RepID=UPI0039A5BB6F
MKNAQDVLRFWFEEIPRKQWFMKDPAFDELVRKNFLETHLQVSRGETFTWRKLAEGRLAEIIVLDQFSRNMFRDTPMSFQFDSLALVLAQEAVSSGADQALMLDQRAFIYMPYMHSESLKIHDEAVRLFSQSGLENSLNFEIQHKKIIERFGRYPHRNAVLGRISTPEEIEFLKGPGSSF